MNTNLKLGMRGDDVINLQQMLRDAGFFKYPTNTGYFGEITQKALQDFQKSRGLQVTGVLDNNTSNILSKEKGVQDFVKMTQGTQYGDLFQQLYLNNDPRIYTAVDTINNPLNQGIFLGGGAVVTPEQLAKYEQIISNEVDPYYQDRANFDKAIYENQLGDINSSYQQSVDDLINSLNQDQTTQNENEGASGTWASSARQERLNSLANKYNAKFNALANTAQGNINQANINREYNYGAGSYQNNPLLRYTASLAQTGTPNLSTTTTKYNPFNPTSGIMQAQKSSSKKAKLIGLIQSQYYNSLENI